MKKEITNEIDRDTEKTTKVKKKKKNYLVTRKKND